MVNVARLRRIIAFVAIYYALGAVMPGVSIAAMYNPDDDKYITIAYVGGLTGELSQASKKSLNALLLAVNEANASGGAHGREFRVVAFDNKFSPANNIGIFENIIRSGATAITGIHVSDDGLILSKMAEEHHIPMVVASATHPDITRNRNYVTRVCFNDDEQGQFLASFAFKSLQKKSAVVVANPSDSFSIYLAKTFEEVFTSLGGVVIHHFFIKPGDPSQRHIVEYMLNNAGGAVIFVSTSAIDSGYLISELISNGITNTILGSDGWQSDRLDTLLMNMRQFAVNAYYSAHWHSSIDRRQAIAFRKKYREAYGEDISSFDADAVLTFDAATVLIDAIRRSRSLDREEVMNRIRTSHIQGTSGDIMIPAKGDPNKTIYMMEIAGGHVRPFK